MKRQPYRNKKILKAARDAPCMAELPGCTGGGDDSCFRHLNEGFAGKGMGQKADDFAGFIGCQHCENLYAGLIQSGVQYHDFKGDEHWYMLRAFYRTIRYLLDEEVIK